jgi:hypothetical protein
MALEELAGGGGAVQAGHGQVGEHHVGAGLLDQGEQLLAVGGLAHHRDLLGSL